MGLQSESLSSPRGCSWRINSGSFLFYSRVAPPSFSSGNCIHSLTNFIYRKLLLKAPVRAPTNHLCLNACYSLLRKRWLFDSHQDQEFLLFLLWGGTSSFYPWLREYWHSSQDTKPLRVDEFRYEGVEGKTFSLEWLRACQSWNSLAWSVVSKVGKNRA
jgi:hypothetical protein